MATKRAVMCVGSRVCNSANETVCSSVEHLVCLRVLHSAGTKEIPRSYALGWRSVDCWVLTMEQMLVADAELQTVYQQAGDLEEMLVVKMVRRLESVSASS